MPTDQCDSTQYQTRPIVIRAAIEGAESWTHSVCFVVIVTLTRSGIGILPVSIHPWEFIRGQIIRGQFRLRTITNTGELPTDECPRINAIQLNIKLTRQVTA